MCRAYNSDINPFRLSFSLTPKFNTLYFVIQSVDSASFNRYTHVHVQGGYFLV